MNKFRSKKPKNKNSTKNKLENINILKLIYHYKIPKTLGNYLTAKVWTD